MLTKRLIKKIEKEIPSVAFDDEGDYWSISVDNPYCEDFSFEISKDENDIKSIVSYCDDFDPDDHAAMWYGQNRGEPSSMRALLENSDAIKEELDKLAAFLRYK